MLTIIFPHPNSPNPSLPPKKTTNQTKETKMAGRTEGKQKNLSKAWFSESKAKPTNCMPSSATQAGILTQAHTPSRNLWETALTERALAQITAGPCLCEPLQEKNANIYTSNSKFGCRKEVQTIIHQATHKHLNSRFCMCVWDFQGRGVKST